MWRKNASPRLAGSTLSACSYSSRVNTLGSTFSISRFSVAAQSSVLNNSKWNDPRPTSLFTKTKPRRSIVVTSCNDKPSSNHSTCSYCTEAKPVPSFAPRSQKPVLDLSAFTPDRIRNFCIISHIDHGKTTLSNALLGHSDKLQVEKERGITVKAHTATLFHTHNGVHYMLNLIDTPGHVDFTYEVTRSLAACQGALLLVDCSQGIQAQTMANFYLAFEANLHLIPVLNKIDLTSSDPKRVTAELVDLGFDESEVLKASAKTGVGIPEILAAVIERVPSPASKVDKPFQAFLFDSWFDTHKGVTCLVKVIDGKIKRGDKIVAGHSKQVYDVDSVGIMFPDQHPTTALYAGQVGYVHAGMRSTKEARVGDTLYHQGKEVPLLPGFKAAKPMVFAGIYPADGETVDKLRDSIEKLTLNDSSVSWASESSEALGIGFRCGFLGLLHMDVFLQRLEQEHGAGVIATAPTVPYRVILRNDTELMIDNPSNFPDPSEIRECQEPMVDARIIVPNEYVSPMMKLCSERRGTQQEIMMLDTARTQLKYRLPLAEIISDFYDKLKAITSGYASFDYELGPYETAQLVKMTVCLNGDEVAPLACITLRSKASQEGRILANKLKSVVPRQMFALAIQAMVDGKCVARETISPFRKDVTAKCYGGDITRKRKLLEKQKEGKKRMKTIGNVELSQEAFYSVLKRDGTGSNEDD